MTPRRAWRDDPEGINPFFWPTVVTVGAAVWIFAIIGFCHVVHDLIAAVRNYFA